MKKLKLISVILLCFTYLLAFLNNRLGAYERVRDTITARNSPEFQCPSISDTTGRTITITKPWGRVVFFQGFPRSLILNHGSQTDLLPGFSVDGEFGAVECKKKWRHIFHFI